MQYVYVFFVIFCIAGAAVWLVASLRRIVGCRTDIARADKQLAMYQLLRIKSQETDVDELKLRQEQVEISQEIYKNAVSTYNNYLERPQNRFPAWILGCKIIIEGVEQ